MSKKIWTKEENEHIVQIHKLYSLEELAEIFCCTEKQIYNKMRKLNLIEVEDRSAPEGYKKCGQCKEIRLLEEFHNNRSKPDGKSTECKYCARENGIVRWRKKKAEKELMSEAENKQAYIDSLKNKKLVCKHHGEQTLDDYRICKRTDGKFFRKCKKCEYEYQKQVVARKLKEQGYV